MNVAVGMIESKRRGMLWLRGCRRRSCSLEGQFLTAGW